MMPLREYLYVLNVCYRTWGKKKEQKELPNDVWIWENWIDWWEEIEKIRFWLKFTWEQFTIQATNVSEITKWWFLDHLSLSIILSRKQNPLKFTIIDWILISICLNLTDFLTLFTLNCMGNDELIYCWTSKQPHREIKHKSWQYRRKKCNKT